VKGPFGAPSVQSLNLHPLSISFGGQADTSFPRSYQRFQSRGYPSSIMSLNSNLPSYPSPLTVSFPLMSCSMFLPSASSISRRSIPGVTYCTEVTA
jgi:hypothetical protein